MALIDALAMMLKVATLAVSGGAAAVLLGAVAHAEPAADVPVDPRAQCEAPDFGGMFVTDPAAPTRAECQYIVEGQFYYDTYDNGMYTGTLVHRDGAKVPTERPAIPELLTIPGGIPLPFLGPT